MLDLLKKRFSLLLLSGAAYAAFNESCTTFVFQSTDTWTLASTFFAAGDRVNISAIFQPIDTTALPAFCRVELAITTNATSNSTTLAEVWLPEDWNGRFLTVGNGGFSGGGNDSLICFWTIGLLISTFQWLSRTWHLLQLSKDVGHLLDSGLHIPSDKAWLLVSLPIVGTPL